MKSIVITIATLIAIPALACIPAGRVLNKTEKKTFATDLAQSNSKCSLLISAKIGKINSENVSVFKDAQEMTWRYTVQSSKGKIKIDAIRVGDLATGKSSWRYMCGEIGPVTRGGC